MVFHDPVSSGTKAREINDSLFCIDLHDIETLLRPVTQHTERHFRTLGLMIREAFALRTVNGNERELSVVQVIKELVTMIMSVQ